MDFLIVYERKQRELENAILLKIELESRGYTCSIYQYYEGDKYNIFNTNPPKVILVPHLYSDSNVYRTFSRFGRSKHLINLQYEQVLSEKWEKLGHHNPKGEANNAIHLCWGPKTKKRLETSGTPPDKLKVLGSLHLDLLRREYRINQLHLKNQLGDMFKLDSCKKWTLFLSSFSYANISDNRLRMNELNAGTSLESFREIHTNSRNKILTWLGNILEKDTENIIIYRPHPDELNLNPVLELEKKFPNFKVISYSVVKNWIEASDSIYSWYSTSVVESHFLDKAYSILRPITLPDSFDSVLLKHATFITDYQEFENDYYKNNSERKVAIADSFIKQYYQVDEMRPAFVNYCDYLEEVYKSNHQQYNLTIINKLKAALKSISVTLVYFLFKNIQIDLDKYRKEDVKKNFLIEWFIEMDNQIVNDAEKKEVEEKIKQTLAKTELQEQLHANI
jgi:surface carbohydrate biosynthesis protein